MTWIGTIDELAIRGTRLTDQLGGIFDCAEEFSIFFATAYGQAASTLSIARDARGDDRTARSRGSLHSEQGFS